MKTVTKITISFVLTFVFVCVGFMTFAQAETLQEKNASIKINYSHAREQYLKEVNFYKNSKKEYQAAKAKFQKQRNSENKAELEEKARNFLENAIGVAIKKLETIKTWVKKNKSLSENDKNMIVSELNDDISWLKSESSKIQNASVSELKEDAKELREYWKNNRVKVKRIVGIVQASRIIYVINKAETASERISEKIIELKEAGYDVTKLEELLADFNEKIKLAKDKYASAQNKFKEIENISNADTLFKEGHSFIKEANTYVKELHGLLVEIVKEMKKTVEH